MSWLKSNRRRMCWWCVGRMCVCVSHDSAARLFLWVWQDSFISMTWLICCSVLHVLQCVAMRCSVLQCVAVCNMPWLKSNMRRMFWWCCYSIMHMLQCVAAVCCSVLQCVAVCNVPWLKSNIRRMFWWCYYSIMHMLQCVAVCCSVLQCIERVIIPLGFHY